MKRREFLKSMTALTAASTVSAPAIWSPAKAQSRQETLLIVSESGPNNLDIHGVGTNVPGYEASWNCYDRLISHEMKTLPNGTPYYDREKFKPELAEDMKKPSLTARFRQCCRVDGAESWFGRDHHADPLFAARLFVDPALDASPAGSNARIHRSLHLFQVGLRRMSSLMAVWKTSLVRSALRS